MNKHLVLLGATLIINFCHGQAQQSGSPPCCPQKTVGGITYLLVEETDTSAWGCTDNCAYQKKSGGSNLICFVPGYLETQCDQTSIRPPVKTIHTLSDGVEQKCTYFPNERLVLEVPAHKDYPESTILFDQKSKTSLLKSNNTCQISSLSETFNVTASANFASIKKGSKTVTKYKFKSRNARLGLKKRKELLSDVQDLCTNVPVVETIDVEINQTNYDELKAGKIVFLEAKDSRGCTSFSQVCSSPRGDGSAACGEQSWKNPLDPTNQNDWVSLHYISSKAVCVSCNHITGGVNTCPIKTWCNCNEITTKIDVFRCSIKSDSNTTIQLCTTADYCPQGPPGRSITQTITQTLHYDPETTSLTISSPAYQEYEALDILFHAYTKELGGNSGLYGYYHQPAIDNKIKRLIKLGNVCFISPLPETTYPFEIATEIQKISKETHKDDEVEKNTILRDIGPLSLTEQTALHSDIQSLCKGSTYRSFTEVDVISQSQVDDLKKGNPINLNEREQTGSCEHQIFAMRKSSGSWRYPNIEHEPVWTNQIVHSVTDVSCCKSSPGSPDCCKDSYPHLCNCEDINSGNVDQCRSKSRNVLFSVGGLAGAVLKSTTEILTVEKGLYTPKKISKILKGGAEICVKVKDFPFKTFDTITALFNGIPIACNGFTSENFKPVCYQYQKDGSWAEYFEPERPLGDKGSSVVFSSIFPNISSEIMWIVGGDPSKTELWGGNPPASLPNDIKLPTKINRACIAKLGDYEAFVTAVPESGGKSLAWIFNIQDNSWTSLGNLNSQRIGAACGYLQTDASERFVVVTGGYGLKSTEVYNLDTKIWSKGPNLPQELSDASMVSIGDEVLLLGGQPTSGGSPTSGILRLDSSMSSWENAGSMENAKSNAGAIAVSLEDLPSLCP